MLLLIMIVCKLNIIYYLHLKNDIKRLIFLLGEAQVNGVIDEVLMEQKEIVVFIALFFIYI